MLCSLYFQRDFMGPQSFDVFLPIVILMAIALGIVGAGLAVSGILRPSKPNKWKRIPYECGEEPVGSAWSFFNVRFYVVGLIFIIFDVESTLMFPVASVFKAFNEIGLGGLVLVEILLFMIILIVAMVYCWSKGDLDWVKSYQKNTKIGN